VVDSKRQPPALTFRTQITTSFSNTALVIDR
jgi:hypothetical protein